MKRRATDHPAEKWIRLLLGTIFGAAAVWSLLHHSDFGIAAFMFGCGMMFKYDMSPLMRRLPYAPDDPTLRRESSPGPERGVEGRPRGVE